MHALFLLVANSPYNMAMIDYICMYVLQTSYIYKKHILFCDCVFTLLQWPQMIC